VTLSSLPPAEPRSASRAQTHGGARAASRMAFLALAAYLIFLAGISMFQDKLLYFPERASVAEMELASGGLSPWPTASDFRGLLAEPDRPARATAIVFHGNAGHAGHRQFYAGALTRLGLRVILAEYPAYGPRGGELGEKSLVADAEQTIALAQRHYGGPLLVIGESLGAAVAAAASDAQRELIAGLLLITPWDRLEQVAAHHYPLLPVQWLLRDHYDSAAHLASLGRPVMVAIAARDSIVPPQFGQALYAALGEPKRLAVIDGAEHNDWFARLDDAWWQEAIAFLLSGELNPASTRNDTYQ
jgi:alpha-beta hydrolase superfamily lysophospholipase